MIKRNTWVLLGIFVIVAGFAYYLQKRPAPTTPTSTPTPGGPVALFKGLDEKTISSLSVKDQAGKTMTIGRDSAGLWAVTEPSSSQPTDASLAEQSVSQVVSLQGQPVMNPQTDLNVYGLVNPSGTIALTLSGDKKDTLLVGDAVPIGDGYYVRLNDGPVQVISKSSLEPVLKLPSNPPFQATATPTGTVTPVGTPIPAGTSIP
jgi:hypothetical protein